MQRKDVLDTLAEHRCELVAFGLRRLALFGSVARDEATPDSDVDLLVEFDGAATFDRYMALNFYLEDLLRHSVDLVTLGSLREFMRASVEQEALDVVELSAVS